MTKVSRATVRKKGRAGPVAVEYGTVRGRADAGGVTVRGRAPRVVASDDGAATTQVTDAAS